MAQMILLWYCEQFPWKTLYWGIVWITLGIENRTRTHNITNTKTTYLCLLQQEHRRYIVEQKGLISDHSSLHGRSLQSHTMLHIQWYPFGCKIMPMDYYNESPCAWLLWHWSSRGQLALCNPRSRSAECVLSSTDRVKISVKEAIQNGFLF